MRPTIVRWARIDSVDPAAEVLNSAARLRTVSNAEERQRVVAARMLLLAAIVDAEACPPDEVALCQRCERCGDEHGRPLVRIAGRRGPHVSVAHAADVAAIAVARQPVGLDVENGENAENDEWVRREAVLKVTGHGLEVDPWSFDLGPASVTRWRAAGPRPVVRIASVELAPGTVAAVARAGRRGLRLDVRESDLTGSVGASARAATGRAPRRPNRRQGGSPSW